MYRLLKRKIFVVCCFIVIVYTYIVQYKICIVFPNSPSSEEQERLIESKIDQEIRNLTSKEIKIVLEIILFEDYIFNNPHLCSGMDKLVALIMVHTAPGHFERRQNIRSTYGSRDIFRNKVRVLFLLGTAENDFLRDAIIQEHRKYKDTVQGNFIDSYQNLTYKGVMGFRWITEHCSHVKYVIKVDDDVVFDTWRFLNFFERRIDNNSIICNGISRPVIERADKWKVYKGNFKNIVRFPFDYCPGFVVILTGDVIESLLKSVYITPFLRIDDVYLYGYLPYTAGNVTLFQFPEKLQAASDEDKSEKCLIQKGIDCEYLAVSIGYKEKNFSLFWFLIEKRNGFS